MKRASSVPIAKFFYVMSRADTAIARSDPCSCMHALATMAVICRVATPSLSVSQVTCRPQLFCSLHLLISVMGWERPCKICTLSSVTGFKSDYSYPIFNKAIHFTAFFTQLSTLRKWSLPIPRPGVARAERLPILALHTPLQSPSRANHFLVPVSCWCLL